MTYPNKSVYLAGHISGLSYEESRNGWRQEFAQLLPEHIHPFSPMRGKDFLKGLNRMPEAGFDSFILATPSAIVTRDRNDVFTCDAMVACFTQGGTPSLGTAIEFGWANAMNKPIIMIADEDDLHREHAMLREMAGYITDSLEEASMVVAQLLTPGI